MHNLKSQSHDPGHRSRRPRSRLPLVAALVGLAMAAEAAVLQMDGVHAIGIREFEMGGERYAVHFDGRSFDEIQADPAYRDPFPFLGTDFQTVEPVLDALNGLLVSAGASSSSSRRCPSRRRSRWPREGRCWRWPPGVGGGRGGLAGVGTSGLNAAYFPGGT